MLHRIHLAWARFELTTLVVIDTGCICSCNSNYHTITTMAALRCFGNRMHNSTSEEYYILVHRSLVVYRFNNWRLYKRPGKNKTSKYRLQRKSDHVNFERYSFHYLCYRLLIVKKIHLHHHKIGITCMPLEESRHMMSDIWETDLYF